METVVVGSPLQQLGPVLREKCAEFTQQIGIEVLRLEDESLELSETVDKVTVKDQIDYEELGERLKLAVEFIDRAGKFFEPWRELFRGPYQGVLDSKKSVLGVVERAVQEGKGRLLTFEREARERAEAEARRRTAQQLQQEADRRLELATQAEGAGMSAQAIDRILEQPSVMPAVQAVSLSRPTGVSSRKNWKAEVVDLAALVKAAAQKPELLVYLQASQSQLDKAAKIFEQAMNIPGVRPVNQGSIAIRK